LCKQVEKSGDLITQQYAKLSGKPSAGETKKVKAFQRGLNSLQRFYPKFYFTQKVTEEFVHMADEHYRTLLLLQTEMAKHPKACGARSPLGIKVHELEKTLWLSLDEYA